MKKLNRGFLFALTLHINAVAMLFQNKKVLSWYKKTILLSVFVSVLLLSLLFFSGVWLVWDLYQPIWFSGGFEKGLLSILWGLVLIFISGLLGSQIAALIVQIIPNENSLMNAIYENHQRRTLVVPKQIRTRWYFSKKEYSAILLNFVIAGLGWPLILIPVLLPLGVIVFSYGLGKEAFAASEKSYFDKKLDTWSEQGHYPGFGYFVGLGLPSVLLGLIPILGFLGFPIVRITSMLAASPEREYLMMDNFRIKKF